MLIRAGVLFIIAFLGLLVSPFPARAAAREDLHRIENQLTVQQQRAYTLDKNAHETSENLKDLREKLIDATGAMGGKEDEATRLEDKREELAQEIEARNTALTGEKQRLGTLTAALVEMSRRPPATLFLQTGLTDDHIHRAILVRALLPRLSDQTDHIAHDLATLDELKAKMGEQQRLTTAARQNLEEQRRNLDQLIRVRQGLLQKTEAEKEQIAHQLVSLTSQANDLRQLLDKISPHHVRPLPPGHPGMAIKWPVSGKMSHRFGSRDADGVTSEGITFTALPGAPVIAPAAGKVVFAGPFKGYGQIVILQHDGGYHSFLAGFGRIDADMDQDVEGGEPLGVLPVDAGNRPELYFEWRRNSEPVDPAQGIAVH